MKMILAFIMTIFALQANAQESTMDSVMNKNRSNRLSVGGYGEQVVFLIGPQQGAAEKDQAKHGRRSKERDGQIAAGSVFLLLLAGFFPHAGFRFLAGGVRVEGADYPFIPHPPTLLSIKVWLPAAGRGR